jgi:hypothetical protein
MEGHVAHRRWKLIDYRIDIDLDEKRRDYATLFCTVACCHFVGRSFETNCFFLARLKNVGFGLLDSAGLNEELLGSSTEFPMNPHCSVYRLQHHFTIYSYAC